jgi:hypothetical protein
MTSQHDTPNAFVVASPWATASKVLYVDLKCFLASVRSNRNVLSARNSARSINNVVLDQTFKLPATGTSVADATYTYTAAGGNVMTVINANRPVRAVITTANGTLDLGQITMFVLSSPIISVVFTNDLNEGDVEINLIAC